MGGVQGVANGDLDVVYGDGTVLRVNGLSTLSELIMDGLVSREERVSRYPGRALGEVEELSWAFAMASELTGPYDAYVVMASGGESDEDEVDEPVEDEEEERRAEQPETD